MHSLTSSTLPSALLLRRRAYCLWSSSASVEVSEVSVFCAGVDVSEVSVFCAGVDVSEVSVFCAGVDVSEVSVFCAGGDVSEVSVFRVVPFSLTLDTEV